MSAPADASENHVDGSVSASHWNNTSLTTVIEHPADAEKRNVAKSIRTLGPSKANTSSAASTVLYSTASTNPSLMSGGKSSRHDRTVSAASAMSSVGPSAEYEEDDLDDDWKFLILEVNNLLTSKGKAPIQSAKCVHPAVVFLGGVCCNVNRSLQHPSKPKLRPVFPTYLQTDRIRLQCNLFHSVRHIHMKVCCPQ
jgi:hypothetical protein